MVTHLQVRNHNRAKVKLLTNSRWEDNIKMDLRKIGFVDVDWIHCAQDRDRWRALVNMVMNLWVP
jgi:hypothetical protein